MFDLRLNASAWFQFQVLMNEIFKVIPANYMKLINNGKMDSSQQRIEERIKMLSFKTKDFYGGRNIHRYVQS